MTRGTILQGRFRIEHSVGHGGTAAVFLAQDLKSGRPVAVKLMRLETAAATRLLKVEGRILQSLRHPNLPHVYDVFEDRGRHFLVMDFIPGRPLSDVIRTERSLSEPRVLNWARQLCDVLEYLHNQRPPIIFRDLKPSNIMSVDNDRIKLIDFGIAKTSDPALPPGATADSTHTAARGMVSPGFSAPEQYAGGTDAASDVYSLGATLFCLFSRTLPPESLDVATGSVDVPDLRSLRPDVSEKTARAIARLMMIDRNQRPKTIEEARVALGFATDDAPARKVDPATTRDGSKFAKGHPAAPPQVDRATGRTLDVARPRIEAVDERLRAETPRTTRRMDPAPVGAAFTSRRDTSFRATIVFFVGALIFTVVAVVFAAHTSSTEAGTVASIGQTVVPAYTPSPSLALPAVTAAPSGSSVPQAPAAGRLTVTSDPHHAAIFLDGKRLGHAPLTDQAVSVGRHRIRLTAAGHQSTERNLVIKSGETLVLEMALHPAAVRTPTPPVRVTNAHSPAIPAHVAAPSPRTPAASHKTSVAPVVSVAHPVKPAGHPKGLRPTGAPVDTN